MALYGSLTNRFAERNAPQTPEVGMGATALLYSDRHAYTIVEVRTPKMIIVQRDKATRADDLGMTDAQSYTYAPDEHGETRTLTLRKDGRWREKAGATIFAIGYRDEHYDYGF